MGFDMNYSYSKEQVGKRLREFRLLKHCTQNQFAEMLNISVNFLSEIENGHKGLSMDMLASVCQILSLSADYILFGEERNSPEPSPLSIADELNTFSTEDLQAINSYINSLLNVRRIPRGTK